MKLDILAIGVHPDDIELGCSGTLMVEINAGKKVGILDLTQGELGSRGTIETRYQEADDAAKIMGIAVRENLKLRDGFFQNDEESQLKLITVIRKYQPEILICNAPEDRHPDHGKSAKLAADAAFLSGLRKIETKDESGNLQEAWRPKYVLNYIQDRYLNPDFIVDISDFIDRKLESVLAYKTQFFNPDHKEPETYISSPEFLSSITSRSELMGKKIGVKHGEGFLSVKSIGLKSLHDLVLKST